MNLKRDLGRLLMLFMTLVMVMVSLPAAAVAEENTIQVTPGLDVIILLDCTGSMSGFSNGDYHQDRANDYYATRLDATVLLINMCDAVNASVAVIPFTDRVYGGSDNKHPLPTGIENVFSSWQEISNPNIRRDLCDNVMKLYQLSGNTDVSGALEVAEKLINEKRAQGSTDNIMVIILTDGKTYIETSGAVDEKKVEAANAESVATADRIKGYEGVYVYGILLSETGNSGKTSEDARKLMENIVTDPEENLWYDVNADDLKARFSNVFARMIGATQSNAQIQINGDRIETSIYIPNKSVTEVNVVFPREYIDAGASDSDSIRIYDGEGQSVPLSSDKILVYNNYNADEKKEFDFVTIKIIQPQVSGYWIISLAKADDVDQTPQKVDLLYNYNVDLRIGDVKDGAQYYCDDPMTFSAYFEEVEEGVEGTKAIGPSQDSDLYNPVSVGSNNEKHGIEAVLHVYDVTNGREEVYTQTLTNDNVNLQFVTELSRAGDVFVPGHTYEYYVYAYGDNLMRSTVTDSFTVVNRKPYATGDTEVDLGTIWIDIELEDMDLAETVCAGSMADYFADDDSYDVLTYEVVQNNSGMNVDGDYTAYAGEVGSYSFTVYATDGHIDDSERPSVTFSFNVASQKALLGKDLTASVEVTGGAEASGAYSYTALKNQTVSFAGHVYSPDFAGIDLDQYTTFEYYVNGQKIDGSEYHTTGVETVEVHVVANIGGIVANSDKIDLNVINQVPVMDTVKAEELEQTVEFDKDDFSGYTVDLNGLASDADNDQITYTVIEYTEAEHDDILSKLLKPGRVILQKIGLIPTGNVVVYAAPAEEAEGAMDFGAANTVADGIITISDVHTGTAQIRLVACDSDGDYCLDENGEQFVVTLSYDVTSLMETIYVIALYIIILILLIVIIALLINKLVIHRPWPTGNGAKYNFYLNNSMQSDAYTGDTEFEFGKKGRSAMTMLYMTRSCNIPMMENLQGYFDSISLWPTTGQAIVVEAKGKNVLNGNIVVTVDGKQLSKKNNKLKWRRNREMIITYNNIVFRWERL